jgi:hypothetical protein
MPFARTPVQINEQLVRFVALLDPPELLFKPVILQRFCAFKAAEYTPGPLKRLLQWWGAGAAAVVEEREHEAALKELMGW